MSNESNPSIINLELLRIALIASKNIASSKRVNKESQKMLSEWLNLCHTLPSILLGESRVETVLYFLEGDAELFVKGYPRKNDADYSQALSLIGELKNYTNRGAEAGDGS